MTRRIAVTILLTVWAVLVAGGFVAHLTIRSILLANLDESLKNRAISLLESSPEPVSVIGSQRSVTRDESRRVGARVPPAPDDRYLPRVVSAWFSQTADARLRTVTVRCYAAKPASEPRALTTTVSDSAAPFDALMNRLSVTLSAFGLAAGLLTAGVAVGASKVALRPLQSTAAQIGGIDERHLGRRLDPASLPPELVPMATRLNEMLAKLEDAFMLRNRFLADASHELRTPVASLLMALDVALARPRDAAGYAQVLGRCREDAGQLRRLVEGLMEQVRSGNLSHDEPAAQTDIALLLDQCIDNVTPLADVKGVSISREYEQGLTAVVAPDRFRGIVMNLLGNAVEYNRPNGGIEVTCNCNGDGLKLSVKDTGPGIGSEHLPHLFEPFYRADKSRRLEAGHLGLGLSLVEAHAQAMAGSCRVESEPGVGSTFRVHLPQPDPSALSQ